MATVFGFFAGDLQGSPESERKKEKETKTT